MGDFVEQVVEFLSGNRFEPFAPFFNSCEPRCERRARSVSLDHLQSFVDYYPRSRTHLGLEKDSPVPRPVQSADMGRVIAMAEVGGLHHRYQRRAA